MMLELLRAGGVRKIRANVADPEYARKDRAAVVGRAAHAQPVAEADRWHVRAGLRARARKVPVGIISNSEGHLAELVEELGYGALFLVVIDCGRVGVDKPNPRIFQLAAEALGVPLSEIVHVGTPGRRM